MSAPTESPAVQLLRKFCGDSAEIRTYMHAPHTIRGRAVATDGKWFAVLPAGTDCSGLESADDRYDPSDLIEIVDAFEGEFISASEIGVSRTECSDCDGTGKATKEDCRECEGAGEFKHGTHWYDCRACRGEGYTVIKGTGGECRACDGRGTSALKRPSTAGDPALGISAASNYVEELRKINGELSKHPFKAEGYGHLWAIRFPGGSGVLMPMRGSPIPIEGSDLAAEARCDG